MIEKSSSALEKTVLVGIITTNQSKNILDEYLDELSFLTFTAGGEVIKKFTQKMMSPDPKLFLGKGKMEELATYIKIENINSVIFDDELTPAQQLNIEKFLKCKILKNFNQILLKKNNLIFGGVYTINPELDFSSAMVDYKTANLIFERQNGANYIEVFLKDNEEITTVKKLLIAQNPDYIFKTHKENNQLIYARKV